MLFLFDEGISFSPISPQMKGLGYILSYININNIRQNHRCKYIRHLQPLSYSFDPTHRCIRKKTLYIRLERRIYLPSDRIRQTSVLFFFLAVHRPIDKQQYINSNSLCNSLSYKTIYQFPSKVVAYFILFPSSLLFTTIITQDFIFIYSIMFHFSCTFLCLASFPCQDY